VRARARAQLRGNIGPCALGHPKIWPCFQLYAGCAPLAPLQQRISCRIVALVRRSLLSLAPAYLRDPCCTTMGIPGRRCLRSTELYVLIGPFARTATKTNRAFSVVGPSLWSGLSLAQSLFTRVLSDTFYAYLKTLLFSRTGIGSALE